MPKMRPSDAGVHDLFGTALSVALEELEFDLREQQALPWADYYLNPRRLRGSDFLMRWSQGVWSEHRITEAMNGSERFFALPYGPSGVAPDGDPREFEVYFEKLEAAGLGAVKRPDLLIFSHGDRPIVEALVAKLGGPQHLPFTPEGDLRPLLSQAILAVECETSLWRAGKMPGYGAALTPQRRLAGRLGLKKTAVVPTVILKEQDVEPLAAWERSTGVPLHIWHVFFDLAFGISFEKARQLISEGSIEGTTQVFQAPGGATTKKVILQDLLSSCLSAEPFRI